MLQEESYLSHPEQKVRLDRVPCKEKARERANMPLSLASQKYYMSMIRIKAYADYVPAWRKYGTKNSHIVCLLHAYHESF